MNNSKKTMARRKPSSTVGGNVNWCRHCGKQYGGFSKKVKIELPYEPEIPLLGIYQKKKKSKHWFEKNRYTPMFIAALFARAKIWKQTRYPSTDEWKMHKKMHMCVCIHTHDIEYYSAIKRMKFCHLEQYG